MNNTAPHRRFSLVCLLAVISVSRVFSQNEITTADGTLAGVYNPTTDVRSFKGVPFAAPPVGMLRWQPPTPGKPWEGVRQADKFGLRAMQRPIFSDMVSRSDGMSEDCLYLNVWTPGKTNGDPLPVLVYFYGGGFQGGDGSEHRYDGESMAAHGMVAVTVNYRLGAFGFLAHPALTAESSHHASGNYGLLDQHAALEWVQRNVAAFGGDPKRVTVAGESAGSFSVSAQMGSPLSKGLLAQAIGESGSLVGGQHPAVPLAEAEEKGAKFAASLGIGDAPTLAALRDLPADRLLAAMADPASPRFAPVVDGYLFPTSPARIYEAGEQAHIPLLAGVNSEEQGYATLLEKAAPTVENYRQAVERLYPDNADAVLRLYPAEDEAQVKESARDLAGDRFIRQGTWRWMDLSTKTGGQPTYYYEYVHPRPPMREGQGKRSVPRGAVHSAEIEYALGNLDGNQVYAWMPEDREVSRQMQGYFVNFIKTGQPNGPGLPEWPKFASGQHLVLDLHPHPESNDPLRARYDLLDRFAAPAADTPASHSLATTPASGSIFPSRAADVTIHNDFFCLDQNGARINTRSGCLRQFNGLFYWYGGTARFHDQTCYTSPDLVHWTNRGVVLHLDVDANRMEVLYNHTTKQYVMFMKYDGNGAYLAIATASVPEGPFTFQSKTLVDNARMGDMSVFQDADGKAYLCYVSWATGTNAQHGIYRMSPDYLTLEKRMFLWDIPHREAPHLFKRHGIYYYGTSKTAGIQSSGTSYYTATNLAGPWSEGKPLRTPGSSNSWDSQVDFVYPFEGTQGTVYMYAGDRWIKNQGRQGDYVWLPLEFDGDEPHLNYYQDWDLNVSAGTWRKFDDSRNLALGKPATASSMSDEHLAGNVTTPATYEDYVNTRWESEASDPQWVMVDLGKPMEINRVILKWGTTCAKAFKIQSSLDANAWSDVYNTAEGAPSSVTDQSFETICARYVRMYGTQRETQRPFVRRNGNGEVAATPQSNSPPPKQNGYSLFSFQVLRN